MYKQLLIIVIILNLYSSCRINKNYDEYQKNSNAIFIEPKEFSENLGVFSKLFESVSYISLETDNDFLIGNIDKLLVTDSFIFVMDSKISRSVFCFDKSGRKVFKINKHGNGPGEYLFLSDISFNNLKKELILYCRVRKKLLYFNLEGLFIREESLQYNIWRMQSVEDKLAIFCDYIDEKKLKESGRNVNIALLRISDMKVTSKANYFSGPVNKEIVWTSNCQFSNINDTILGLKPDHCNVIYHITPKTIYPAFILDFDKFNVDERYWTKLKKTNITLEEMDKYCNKLKLCESARYVENDYFIYFVFRQVGKVSYVFYSKETNLLQQFSKFNNDMDKVSVFRPIAVSGDKFYSILESSDIFYLKKYSIESTMPKRILDNIQEYNNPVIIVFKLKPF